MLRAALLVVLAGAAIAQPPPAIETIVVSDCNGGLHLLPGHPLEFNLNLRMIKRLTDAFAHTIVRSANCTAKTSSACPGLPESDAIMHFFPSIQAILNYLGGSSRSKLADTCASLFSRSWGDTSLVDRLLHYGNTDPRPFGISGLFNAVPLPSTCTLASLAAGKGCTMEFDVSAGTALGVKLQVAVDNCPRVSGPNGASMPSIWPYISVSCAGSACANLFAPCARIGSDSECGRTPGYTCTDHLALLNVNPPTPIAEGAGGRWQGIIAEIMKAVTLLKETSDLDGCGDSAGGTKNGRAELVRRFRDMVMAAMGRTPPAAGAIADADIALGFCMPSKDTFDSIGKKLSAPVDNGLLKASDSSVPDSILTTAEKACFDKGCRPAYVGDGKCDLACFVPECYWDGNDCGAPGSKAGDLPLLATPYDAQTMVGDMDAYCTAPGAMLANGVNTFERCNGIRSYYYGAGTSYVAPGGGVSSWTSWCNYGNYYYTSSQPRCTCYCPLKPGATSSGDYCENCLQLPALAGQYFFNGSLKAAETSVYSGLLVRRGKVDSLEPLVMAWNGNLASGASVLSNDRKSGIAFRTPPTTLDPAKPPSTDALAGGLAPVLQLSCTGEITMSLGSPALGISMSMPRLMELVSLAERMGHFALNCRIKARARELGTASPLTRAQFLLRYGLHQLGSWFYQMTSFGAPRIETTGNALPAAILKALGGGAAGTRFGPITNLTDYLILSREPAFMSGQTDEKAGLLTSSWGTFFRMQPPHADECSLASLLDPGNRRCRFTWSGLGSLLKQAAGAGAPDVVARVHVDVRNDVCAGAPKAGTAGAPTLSEEEASYAAPAGAIWIESPTLVGTASQLRFCGDDTDCVGLTGTVCTDIESNLGDWVRNLDGKRPNPLSVMLFGRSPAGHRTAAALECGSTMSHFRTWFRFIASAVVGRSPPARLTGNTPLKMCAPKLSAIGDAISPWADSIFTPGTTCTKGGSCLPVSGGAPATINGFGPPVHEALYPSLASAGTARAVVAPPPKSAVTIGILLPTLTLDSFTNAVKARLLAAVVEALAAKGIIVPLSAVVLTAVEASSAEVPTSAGSRRRALQASGTMAASAVAVRVAVDFTQATILSGSPAESAPSVSAALSAELTSGDAGTVGASIGAVLANAGVIPAGVITAAASKPDSWVPPPALGASNSSGGGASAGAIAGGIIGGLIILGAIGAAVFFFVIKPRRAPSTAKKAAGPADAGLAKPSAASPSGGARASQGKMAALFELQNPMSEAVRGRNSEAPTPVKA